MEKVKKVFSGLIGWVFFIVFSIILLCVFFADGDRYSFSRNNPFISILIALIFGAGIFFLYRKLTKKDSKLSMKKEIIIVASALTLFLCLGLLTIVFLRVHATWDVGHIYGAALNMINEGDFGSEYSYISNFPFQTFLVSVFVVIISSTSAFLPPAASLILFNLFCIIGTILFFYLTIRKLLGVKKAIFSLVLFLFFSPIILYTPIFYSDTISMLFVTLGFYLALILFDEDLVLKKRIILSLFLGLICFCGYQIKATSAILIIAIGIFVIFVKNKVSLKNFMISIACSAIIFFPLSIIVSNFTKKITEPSLNIPQTHWVMMGLKNYGGFNMEDYTEITYIGLENGEDLAIAHVKTIKRRLEDYGVDGYLNFLSKKVAFTWGDGTYYVSDKLRREPFSQDSLAYKVVATDGEYFTGYNIFMNGMQIMLLATVVIGAFITRKDRSAIIIIKLALLGLALFLLVWETRSRYLINYLPLMLVLFMFSLDKLSTLPRFSRSCILADLCSRHKSSQHTHQRDQAKSSVARPKSKSSK